MIKSGKIFSEIKGWSERGKSVVEKKGRVACSKKKKNQTFDWNMFK